MAIINLTPGEFGDFVMIYLLDKVLHPDEVSTGNERFNDTIDLMSKRGLKSQLTKYYLSTNAEQRFNYKRIKDVFDSSSGNFGSIRIGPHKEEVVKTKEKDKEKEKEGLIKKLGKKALKKLIGQGPESLSKEDYKMLNEYIEILEEID
jgi:hypothetical protein